MTTLYDAQILSESGLKCFLPLSEAAGSTTCADVSGNGFTATTHGAGLTLGAAALLVNDAETACGFDGTNSYLSVASLGITNEPFSLEVWLDCVGDGSLPDGSNYDTLVAVNASQRILYNPGNRQFLIQNGGGNFFSALTYPLGAPYYFAYVWDGTQESMYLNGVLDSHFTPPGAPSWNGAWYIGVDVVSGQYAWNGRLAKVAIYTAALSPAQITLHAALGRNHILSHSLTTRDGQIALSTRSGAMTLVTR